MRASLRVLTAILAAFWLLVSAPTAIALDASPASAPTVAIAPDRIADRSAATAPEPDRHAHRPTAASLLRRMRPELRESVSRWTSAHPYTIDQVVRDMADRCKQLKLRLTTDDRRARAEAHLMILAQTMKYLHGGNLPVAL